MGIDKKVLKKQLLTDFHDVKHKRWSLIEIFVFDQKYYGKLVSAGKVTPELSSLISAKKADIEQVSHISLDAMRKLQYELIIDNYVAAQDKEKEKAKPEPIKEEPQKKPATAASAPMKKTSPETKKVQKKNTNTSQTNKIAEMTMLRCPVHTSRWLTRVGIKVAVNKENEKLFFPMYRCEKCEKAYTYLSNYRNGLTIRLDGEKFTNIQPPKPQQPAPQKKGDPGPKPVKMLQPGMKCNVYGSTKPSTCSRPGCNNASLILSTLSILSKKKKVCRLGAKECPVCGMFYVSYPLYLSHEKDFVCLNSDHLEIAKIAFEKKQEQKRLQREEHKRKKEEEKRRKEEQKRLEQGRIEAQRKAREARELEWQKKVEERERKWKESVNTVNPAQKVPYDHDNTIHVKDFVVRRNIFKCRHKDHVLKNIDAKISVINKDGEVVERTVAAGYCANCNTFFIMESTYQNLKNYGTPVCRVSDEKTYLNGSTFINGMQLAQQSVLMQYGYSVSQEEGLTSARRRKILSLMVDNNILTRSDIIGYLDFFINTKSSQPKFEKAIEKWENDRDFISQYKIGSYTKYGVSGIHRKY